MRHHLRHLIGCLLPIVLIFVLPLFGVGEGTTLFVFIVLMFICHLAMLGGHGHRGTHEERHDALKGDRHEHT